MRPPKRDLLQMEFYKRKLPSSCISFSSTEGKGIFKEALLAGHMDCYFQVASQFKTQEQPAFCGLSTLIIILNALEIDPRRVWKGPWRWYHEDMLDCCVPLDIVEKRGITMDQFACLAACNMLQVKMVHVDEQASLDRFREIVKSITKQSHQLLVVSYTRLILEQTGDGHYSPIGGYNPERDMVLIMDTARFKYPPHWVSLGLLFKAMQVVDPSTNLPRGYFVLSKNQFSPGILFRLSPFFSPLSRNIELVLFFNAWGGLLATRLSKCDMAGSDVAEMALAEVLKFMADIKNDVSLLSIQFNSSILEEVYHHCYSHHIIQMINSLESLPLYDIVCKKTSHVSHDVMVHAGQSLDVRSLSEINNRLMTDELVAVVKCITSTHFLTMFMLSWPYEGCKCKTFGSNLHAYTASQLAQSGPELQKESARIRLQLSSIFEYVKNCYPSSCCTTIFNH